MCLELKSSLTRQQIAKKDITVYKVLSMRPMATISESINHGDYFNGIIKGSNCEGRISIESDGSVFLCNNKFDGNYTPENFGYKYTWELDNNVESLTISGETYIPEIISSFVTIYQNTKIKIGNTYTSKLVRRCNRIYDGLHSYKKLSDAKDFVGYVAKCIIPKGSAYYVGTFSGNVSYASDKLTYVEIIR